MSVKCAWASIDERGRASGGKAGDQTGNEVKVGNWYKFGKTAVYRWKDRKKAAAFAKCAETLAKNPADGYDQGERTTLNSALKAIKWAYTKLKKPCECDCSAFVVACVNCVATKELLSPSLFTGNIGDALMKTGLFIKLTGARYCNSDSYLMTGDIINAPYNHVIIALGNGSKAAAMLKKEEKKAAKKTTKKSIETVAKEICEGKWGNDPVRTIKLKAAGYTVSEIKAIRARVNSIAKANKAAAKKAKAKYYTVKRGDNLSYIANKYKTTVNALVKLNKLKNANIIYPGQKIRVK